MTTSVTAAVHVVAPLPVMVSWWVQLFEVVQAGRLLMCSVNGQPARIASWAVAWSKQPGAALSTPTNVP